MTINRKTIFTGLILAFSSVSFSISAQDVIEIEPLFEYPSAPEELPSIEEKSDYLMDHFWDAMDFKSKTTVDQNALNDAFRVFSVPLRWANRDKALVATDKLIENISKNPVLLLQFTKAAEEAIYGPRTEVWVDEVYLKFLNALLKNKKIPDQRKKKYQKQYNSLSASLVGNVAPQFTFTTTTGKESTYFPMATSTLIIFGDPTDTDWRLTRLRMESNTALSQAIEKGKINVLFIVPRDIEGWEKEVASYPSSWTVGKGVELDAIYDIRTNPSVYAINSEGKILCKNAPVATSIQKVLEQVK